MQFRLLAFITLASLSVIHTTTAAPSPSTLATLKENLQTFGNKVSERFFNGRSSETDSQFVIYQDPAKAKVLNSYRKYQKGSVTTWVGDDHKIVIKGNKDHYDINVDDKTGKAKVEPKEGKAKKLSWTEFSRKDGKDIAVLSVNGVEVKENDAKLSHTVGARKALHFAQANKGAIIGVTAAALAAPLVAAAVSDATQDLDKKDDVYTDVLADNAAAAEESAGQNAGIFPA